MEVLSLLLILSFISYLFWRTMCRRHSPPGPWPLPFLGNMLQLFYCRSHFLKSLEKMAETYGSVFSVYLAETHLVFINGYSAVKEVLVTNSTEFADRPVVPITEYMSRTKGIIMERYGPVWKEQRKFLLTFLRNKKLIEETVQDEATNLIQAFKENMSRPFDPNDLISATVTNVISTLMLGKPFDLDDSSFWDIMELIHKTEKLVFSPWAMIYNSVPFVRKLLLPLRMIQKTKQKLFGLCRKEIEEHKATHVCGQPRGFIDKYLEEIKKQENKELDFEDYKMLVVFVDMYIAGSETMARTLSWALLYMVAFPEIQEKCQEEMDTVLGENSCLEYEDRKKLPYTNAVIHEIQRVSNVVPLGIPHAPLKDVQLHGYTIKKGTTVVINLASVHCDKSQWKYPCEFNPANFMNEGDFLKPEAFMPFSAGPRICLGESLARMELFLFFTSILRNFRVLWPHQSEAPNLTANFGLAQSPNPFKVVLKCRRKE